MDSRRQVIIRERLKFPSGFSTAVLISVLHGQNSGPSGQKQIEEASKGDFASLVPREDDASLFEPAEDSPASAHEADESGAKPDDWAYNMRLLIICFLTSGIYTVCTYFIPILRNLPIFGTAAASTWLWTLNPSLAYVGQGIIMGTETTMHMLLGAIVGWGVLSPLAKARGWAPGPVDDWEEGSKGWILWVSLAIMLVDAIVSLAYVALRSVAGNRIDALAESAWQRLRHVVNSKILRRGSHQYSPLRADGQQRGSRGSHDYSPVDGDHDSDADSDADGKSDIITLDDQGDAPAHQRVGPMTVSIGLILSILLCVVTIHIVFGDLVPLYATFVAVLMALVLSIMGVRALGETDLNPVSGISKLAQLFFALIIPQTHPSSVLINLVAGAVSEAGALQAGDLMQDLKTGHLLGAAPRAQFWGQVIGATCGAVLSAFIYRLYTS